MQLLVRALWSFVACSNIAGSAAASTGNAIFPDGFDGPCLTCHVEILLSTPNGFDAESYFTPVHAEYGVAQVQVARDQTSVVGALSSFEDEAPLLSVVPSRTHLDSYLGNPDVVMLTYRTTAATMLYLTPGLFSHEPNVASDVWATIEQTPEVQALGDWLSAHHALADLDSLEFHNMALKAVNALAPALHQITIKYSTILRPSGVGPSYIFYVRDAGRISPSLADLTLSTLVLVPTVGDPLYRHLHVEHVPPPYADQFFHGYEFADPSTIHRATVPVATSPIIGTMIVEGKGNLDFFGGPSELAKYIFGFTDTTGAALNVGVASQQDVFQIRGFSGALADDIDGQLLSTNPSWQAVSERSLRLNLTVDVLSLLTGVMEVTAFSDELGTCVKDQALGLFNTIQVGGVLESYGAQVSFIADTYRSLIESIPTCYAETRGWLAIARTIALMVPVLREAEGVERILSASATFVPLAERLVALRTAPSINTLFGARVPPPPAVLDAQYYRSVFHHGPGDDVEFAHADFYAVLETSADLPIGSEGHVLASCESTNCIAGLYSSLQVDDDSQLIMSLYFTFPVSSSPVTSECYALDFYIAGLQMPMLGGVSHACFKLVNASHLVGDVSNDAFPSFMNESFYDGVEAADETVTFSGNRTVRLGYFAGELRELNGGSWAEVVFTLCDGSSLAAFTGKRVNYSNGTFSQIGAFNIPEDGFGEPCFEMSDFFSGSLTFSAFNKEAVMDVAPGLPPWVPESLFTSVFIRNDLQ